MGRSSDVDSTVAAGATSEGVADALAETAAPSEPLGDAPPELGAAAPPSQRYVNLGEVARGGLGRISRVRDRHLDRSVVVKEMLRRGRDEGRFVREALVTASLQHPAIVPVYDAGRWDSGEPFFAMRPIEGRHLGDALAATRTLGQRLALLANLLRAAEAMAYAHAHGVIHRDLKPSNILVGEYGDTVVIDWGLAKRIGERDEARSERSPAAHDSAHTVAGAVMGTPAYMPPEQAESSDAVDARADVYALGAILYQLLVGTPPFTGSSSEQILERVRSEPAPSIVARVPEAPRDLVAIAEKAMARNPGERYANAGELVVELERFTTGRLVAAHEYTRRELIARFVRKHRAAVGVATIAFMTLAVTGTIAITQIIRARDQARADRARALVARDETERKNAEILVETARGRVSTDPFGALATLARLPDSLDNWTPARFVAADAVGTGLPLRLDVGPVDRFAISPDGKVLAAVLEDGHVMTWSEGMSAMRGLEGTTRSPMALTMSRDGRWLFAGDTKGRLLVWNTQTGKQRVLREQGPQVIGARPRADGSVVIYDDGPVVFPADGGEPTRPLGVRVRSALTFPLWDDRYVVEVDRTTGTDVVEVIDLERAEVILAGTNVIPDGGPYWYSASTDRRVEMIGGELRIAGQKPRPFRGEMVSPDGAFVIVKKDGSFAAYDVANDTYRVLSAGDDLQPIGFLGSNHRVAIRDSTTVHIYDLDRHTDTRFELGFELYGAGEHWLVRRDGKRGVQIIDETRAVSTTEIRWPRYGLLAVSPSGRWRVVRTRKPVERIDVLGPDGAGFELARSDVRAAAISSDERWLAIVAPDGAGRLRELTTGTERRFSLLPDAIRIWVGAGGTWVVGMVADRVVAWSAADGGLHELGKEYLIDVAAAGPHVVTTTGSGQVTVWDAQWRPVRALSTQLDREHSPEHPDIVRYGNNLIAAADAAVPTLDGAGVLVLQPTLRLVDVASGNVRWKVDGGHTDCDPEMVVHDRVVAYCNGGIELLDAATGRSVATFTADERPGLGVLSDDGTRAFTIYGTSARIWDVASGSSRKLPWHITDDLWYQAAFDGATVRVIGPEGVDVIPEDVPSDPKAFRAWLRQFADARDGS